MAMKMKTIILLLTTVSILACNISFAKPSPNQYDIVVYGGTSAGVICAVQAAKLKKSVVLIEPGNHLGGMTSSGLGWVDTKRSTGDNA